MKSNTLLTKVAGAAVVALVVATTTLASPVDEPQYLGRNLNYWMSVIRDRNQDMISLAFEAIRWLGPEARAAVPDLTALIEAPFTPIRIGKDSQKVIASKLYEIEVRAGAIDALASIGESASPAALSLVRWALMPHVVVENIRNMDDQELFIELAIMDTEQRMRVAGAIPEFGRDASPVIAGLLSSPDAEKATGLSHSLFRHGKPHPESCAFTGFGFNIEPSSMPFRKCVDNREPEAGADRSFGGEKWLEDTIPDFWRDSRTVIGDFDPDPAVG